MLEMEREFRRLKSSCRPTVLLLAIVIAGLRLRLIVRELIVGAIVLKDGGVVEVSRYVNCGLESVIPSAS